MICPRKTSSVAATARFGALAFCGALGLALVLALSLATFAQQPPPAQQPSTAKPPDATPPPATPAATQAPNSAPDAAQQPAAAPETQQTAPAQVPAAAPQENQPATVPAEQAPAGAAAPAAKPAAAQASKPEPPQEAGITEEELKQMLVGKALYLRGGYLDNTLSFSERGTLIGHSPQGSYTLSAIQIDRVHLSKHKVELEGARYGLHFLGALPYEDPTKALDRVKITPKKKVVRITIDRELVVTPKKKKEPKADKDKKAKPAAPAAPGTPAAQGAAAAPAASTPASAAAPDSASAATPAAPAAQPTAEPAELSEADQLKASIAAAPPEERPADPGSITTTTSPAHATKLLKDALDRIFAQGLDERMIAAMPDFWKLYYQAVAAKTDYRPKDPTVLRQSTVDKKAVLVTRFEPESNDFAQASGVAGMALYHTVIGADGKPAEIAVARPIGFGLDENAVEAIRKATFEPALLDGKPVPVLLDLVVQFRIYSKRTAVAGKPEAADKSTEPQLPGPYSVQRP
jgi:outer membrane biosynthesis protein TonB